MEPRSQDLERFLVTGGQGFLGAWIARRILAEGCSCMLFDLRPDDGILSQVLEPADLGRLERLHGDVTDGEAVLRAVAASGATRVIHLAGLQIPTCRADPLLGARVNVLGTLNVFEAARVLRSQVRSVVYASSAAVAGRVEDYSGAIPDDAPHVPRTHYGVYKTANEGNARVYWLDNGIPSVGLRPLAVYGPGREVGITSGPTKAIKAAVLEREYTIGFSGTTGFNYVEDAARVFVDCARSARPGAFALNLRGEIHSVSAFVRAIAMEIPGSRGKIRFAGPSIPVAHEFLEEGLEDLIGPVPHTPLAEGVRRTAEAFRRLLDRGALHYRDLEA
ncbi:MAG TPA: NAD(P)-dependent oxidoreductase [Planctomycetota bacterium]|nr:NAD(P)-dependent oxidoreductase [Planctomycetota bacterium]